MQWTNFIRLQPLQNWIYEVLINMKMKLYNMLFFESCIIF